MHSKRIATFFKYLFLSLSILVALVLIGINLPAGNRIITETANSLFREKNIPVQVKKIGFLINGKMGLDQVKIVRNEADTLVYAGQVRVSVRVLPLVLRKVKVKNVTLNDATIYLKADSLTGAIDLLSLFVTAERPTEQKTKSGKKWDIIVNALNLKNVRFVYNDDFRGIRIDQYVEALSVRVDRFSLNSRQIYADFIEMEKAHGELTLSTASNPENPVRNPDLPGNSGSEDQI